MEVVNSISPLLLLMSRQIPSFGKQVFIDFINRQFHVLCNYSNNLFIQHFQCLWLTAQYLRAQKMVPPYWPSTYFSVCVWNLCIGSRTYLCGLHEKEASENMIVSFNKIAFSYDLAFKMPSNANLSTFAACLTGQIIYIKQTYIISLSVHFLNRLHRK